MKRVFIIIAIVMLLAVLAFAGYQQYQRMQANSAAQFQTVPITAGDLTASVGAADEFVQPDQAFQSGGPLTRRINGGE